MPSTTAANILALEPWHSGSHQAFLQGLIQHSNHRIHPLTLPGRFWKWRQTGSGLILGERFLKNPPPCELIFASDFTHLPDFLALTRRTLPTVPVVLYCHENQLTYPLQQAHQLDRAYLLANLSGAAVADAVWFNSRYHMEAFLAALPTLIGASPDYPPNRLVADITQKSHVLPLGVDLTGLTALVNPAPALANNRPLTILWNHRWEHDKNPDEFFATLFKLDDAGVKFELIVAGQGFNNSPAIFVEAQHRLAHRIYHWGHAAARSDYAKLLARADVVVSLAHHDFFGISVVEAMAMGCLPLLAHRLNYPYLVPTAHHGDCLVDDADGLLARLTQLCADPAAARAIDPTGWAAPYDWQHTAPAFDAAFTELIDAHGK